MEETPIYMRIGTKTYKHQNMPLANGKSKKVLTPWSKGTLIEDFGNDYASDIPKYEGFCTIPSHVNYQRIVDGYYNLYNPISHTPEEGSCDTVLSLVRHIFEEHMELGLDYLSLLYLKPTQKLPILLLVSVERNTGKTTFLNFLKAVFQENITFNTNEDFRSQFNSDWAGKLIVAVDEVLLDRREDAERLKNLSTARTYKIEAKGKDRQELEFHAKFVLCSNNETFPIIIDPGETRYWVRKIRPLQSDDTHFLEKLIREIPAFLYYLQHRPISTKEESRMWFKPEDIRTEALDRIISCTRDRTEVAMMDVLKDIMAVMNVDKVSFTLDDMTYLLNCYNNAAERTKIHRILKGGWGLENSGNSLRYTAYVKDFNEMGHYDAVARTGRYYTVTEELLKKL